MIKTIYIVVCPLVIAVLLFNCTNDSLSGNTSETGNQTRNNAREKSDKRFLSENNSIKGDFKKNEESDFSGRILFVNSLKR